MRATSGSWLAPVVTVAAVISAACAGTSGSARPGAPTITIDEVFEARYGAVWQNTDFTRRSVEPNELMSGGPGKDGIPAIDNPKFVTVDEADAMLVDDEPVIVVTVGDDARAYPVQILLWHEIVNDVVGGSPLAVTYCPLCNSAIAFERELDGTVYDFGVSGLLRNSDLVMYDRQTESWWQQFTGEAIVGALTGAVLEFVPASTISFEDFRETHPEGLVLSRDTGYDRDYGRNPYAGYDSTSRPFLFDGDTDGRLPPAERVVAVEINGENVAYPFSALEQERVIEDSVGGTNIVVFFTAGTKSALDESAITLSRDVGASGVFFPEVDGRALTFERDDDRIVDRETGSKWSILGQATGGPLEGATLTPVVHGDHFWFAWAAFKPDTRIWSP